MTGDQLGKPITGGQMLEAMWMTQSVIGARGSCPTSDPFRRPCGYGQTDKRPWANGELAMQGLSLLHGSVQVFAVLSLPVAIVAGLIARRCHRGLPARERHRLVALDLALALTLLGIASVTLLPLADYHRGFEQGVQLRPFASIGQQLTSAISASVVLRIVGFNVLLFVPLGFVLRLRSLGWIPTMIAVVATSIVIETLQAILPLGRTTNIDDVLLNTAGGLLGAASASLALGIGPGRHARRASDAPLDPRR